MGGWSNYRPSPTVNDEFLVDWSCDGRMDWLVDWLIDCLVACLIDWLIHWMINWLIDWSIDWWIDWLIYPLQVRNIILADFRDSLKAVRASLSPDSVRSYEQWNKNFGSSWASWPLHLRVKWKLCCNVRGVPSNYQPEVPSTERVHTKLLKVTTVKGRNCPGQFCQADERTAWKPSFAHLPGNTTTVSSKRRLDDKCST